MLAALEDRVNLNTRRETTTSGVGQKKARARLNESSEILGMLRNVVAAWDADFYAVLADSVREPYSKERTVAKHPALRAPYKP
jgi:hypothetical protein